MITTTTAINRHFYELPFLMLLTLAWSMASNPPVYRHKCSTWSMSPTCTVQEAAKSQEICSFFSSISWTVCLLEGGGMEVSKLCLFWMACLLTSCSGISAWNPVGHCACAVRRWSPYRSAYGNAPLSLVQSSWPAICSAKTTLNPMPSPFVEPSRYWYTCGDDMGVICVIIDLIWKITLSANQMGI